MSSFSCNMIQPDKIRILDQLAGANVLTKLKYSNFRNYAPPLDEKGGIITEKVVPVFSESLFGACFGMVM